MTGGTQNPGQVSVSYPVRAETSWGQNVFVVGNVPRLGSWNPANAVPPTTNSSTYPSWRTGSNGAVDGDWFRHCWQTARVTWQNTTHDWTRDVDVEHLERIRRDPATFAPGGVTHLVLEVLAYAVDEASSRGTGRAVVTLHDDGSISVADDGRGTDTRVDAEGRTVKKPVMATKDLRFFDVPSVLLPDGHPRRGMSVVAALSEWLVHTNRRLDGSWTQRYEHGMPVTDLTPIDSDGTTGTTVHFLPSPGLAPVATIPADFGPHLDVDVIAG